MRAIKFTVILLSVIFLSAMMFAEEPTFPPEEVTGPFPTGDETVRDDSPVDAVRTSNILHEYTCYKTETAPVIDGEIDDDEIWALIPWTVMTWWENNDSPIVETEIFAEDNPSETWTGVYDCTGYFKMLWDGSTVVYLAIEVMDDTYNAYDNPDDPNGMHVADCIQFGLQTSPPEDETPDNGIGSELGFCLTDEGQEMFMAWAGSWHAWSFEGSELELADGDNDNGNATTDGKAIHASVEEGSPNIYRFEVAINLDVADTDWLDYIEEDYVCRLSIMAMDQDERYEDVNFGSGILTKSFERLASVLFSSQTVEVVGIGDLETPGVPGSYNLTQNYPNPFNPVTRFDYTITNQEFVQINVYNTLGQKVANLVNHEQFPGTYTVEFDGTNLPSGIYFYKLETKTTELTRKMMLLK